MGTRLEDGSLSADTVADGVVRPRESGPVAVRASTALLNGSEEHEDDETTSHARADPPQLREADRLLGEGVEVPEVAKALEVSAATYHRWRVQYGGMKADDVKRLKELE